MENSPVVDDVHFNDDVCLAMLHWLISCSLSVDLNIKSPHPNFSEINTFLSKSSFLSKICLKGGLSHWDISCIVCIGRLKKGNLPINLEPHNIQH